MVRSRVALVAFGVFCMVISPAPAQAQGIAKSFDELRLLIRPGDTVTVTESKTGTEIKGKVFGLSPASLILTVDGRQREWREGELGVIHQRRSDSLRNGALWGFGIGGVLGVVLGATVAADDTDATAFAGAVILGAVYGGIGAGIGVGFDAIVTKRLVIYEKRTTSGITMGISPILDRGRTGAAFSLRF